MPSMATTSEILRVLLLAGCLGCVGAARANLPAAAPMQGASAASQAEPLDEATKARLRQSAETMALFGKEVVVVLGHADASERDPRGLSLLRAKAVRLYLMQLGVPPTRVHYDAEGSERPLHPSPDDRNRRVQVEFVGGLPEPAASAPFSWMRLWLQDLRTGASPGQRDEFSGITPLAFLPRVEPALRPRFLAHLQLAAIAEGDDALLRQVRALPGAELAAQGPLPPALLGLAMGTDHAQLLLQEEASRIPVTDPRRRDLATALWCDARSGEQHRAAVLRVLGDGGALPLLPDALQARWVQCARGRGDDVRWLQRQGLRSLAGSPATLSASGPIAP